MLLKYWLLLVFTSKDLSYKDNTKEKKCSVIAIETIIVIDALTMVGIMVADATITTPTIVAVVVQTLL